MSYSLLKQNLESSTISRFKIIGYVLLTLGAFILLSLYSFRDTSPEGYTRAVNAFEGRKRVNTLCNELPRPNGVFLNNRSIEGSTQTHAVSFRFESKLKTSEVKAFYLKWFNANGWTLIEDGIFDFEKNGQIVSIGFVGEGYAINCSEPV